MTFAFQLKFEACRPRLYALPDQAARTRLPPGCAAAGWSWPPWSLACSSCWRCPSGLGGSTLAQAAPAQGQEYIVKAGDTLSSIAMQADPSNAALLTDGLAREVGSNVVVPGEHVFIP